MRKTYQRPEIWVEELMAENSLLGNTVSNIQTNLGNSTLRLGGGSNGGARAGESHLWDDNEEDDSSWDTL